MSDPRGTLFYRSRQQIKIVKRLWLSSGTWANLCVCFTLPSPRSSVSPGPGDKMILVEEGDQTLCPAAVPEYVINGNNRVKGVCGVVLWAAILRFQGRKEGNWFLWCLYQFSLFFLLSLTREEGIYLGVVNIHTLTTTHTIPAYLCGVLVFKNWKKFQILCTSVNI